MAGLTPQEFVSNWRGVTLKERSASQSHFIDLCKLLDQPTPTEADPTGEFYTFERGAENTAGPTGGAHGWADVWKKGHFAWECKGPSANLETAYEQLLQYREALDNPPLPPKIYGGPTLSHSGHLSQRLPNQHLRGGWHRQEHHRAAHVDVDSL